MRMAICGVSVSRNQKRLLQEEFGPELLFFYVLIPLAYSRHSRLRSAVSFVRLFPLLLRERLDRLQFLLMQSGIDARQLLGGKLIELFDYVFQFVAQRVRALRL